MNSFLKLLNLLNQKEKIFLIITFLLSFVVMALETVSVAIIPVIFTKIIELDNFNELEKVPLIVRDLLNYLNTKYTLLIFVICLFLTKSLINYFHYIFDYIVIKRIRIRLTKDWLDQTLKENYLTIQATPVSHKIWCTNVIDTTAAIISNYLNLFKGIIICGSILGVIIFFSKGDLIIFYSIVLLIVVTFYFVFSKKISNFGKISALAIRERLDILQSTFTGIKNIIIYKKQNYFQKSFLEKNLNKERSEQSNAFINGIPLHFIEFIGILFICVYFYVSLRSGVTKSELIFNIGLISYGSLRILSFFKVITSNLSLIKNRKFNIDTLVEQFENFQRFKGKNLNHYKYNCSLNDNTILKIENLNFSYNQNPLIFIKNFEFKKNYFYLIIGDSGKGKSTFLDLMLNIIKPTKGKIDCAVSHNEIGYVSQESFMINDTIKKNIAFAENDSEINNDKVQHVLEQVNLKEFIDSLPEKENYVIRNNGSNLSVGQKQRIGIARALYYQPKIVFLDEPTSSLDESNEINLLSVIEKIKKNSTVIMVTHKFKNIKKYDKLLELSGSFLEEKKI